jgi:hypothetical protein
MAGRHRHPRRFAAVRSLALPVGLAGGLLGAVAASVGKLDALADQLTKWPLVTPTPDGFALLVLLLMLGAGTAAVRFLSRIETSPHEAAEEPLDTRPTRGPMHDLWRTEGDWAEEFYTSDVAQL